MWSLITGAGSGIGRVFGLEQENTHLRCRPPSSGSERPVM